jgi:predicted nucleic acid-binding protein
VIWLIDTNTVVHALNGMPSVRDRLNALADGDRVVTSAIVVAELVYGVECSARQVENRRNLEDKLKRIEVVDLSRAIAIRIGVLKAQLRSRGRLKADLDLLIAASALEIAATLVTDDGDLLGGDIPDLLTENWVR